MKKRIFNHLKVIMKKRCLLCRHFSLYHRKKHKKNITITDKKSLSIIKFWDTRKIFAKTKNQKLDFRKSHPRKEANRKPKRIPKPKAIYKPTTVKNPKTNKKTFSIIAKKGGNIYITDTCFY